MHDRHRRVNEIGPVVREPSDARVTTEPGVLPTGEASRRPDRLRLGLLRCPLPAEIAKHLGITQGMRRRPAFPQPDGLELTDLLDEPARPHVLDADRNAPIELWPRYVEPDLGRGVDRSVLW